ncbi:MAG: hypothetical protein ACRCYC_15280 [Paraclostridium sp.]|uniref:hypothetical protein n=1 Tax=Paraclostridium sp. TaxID=2023273 RepID=UPI003F2A324F
MKLSSKILTVALVIGIAVFVFVFEQQPQVNIKNKEPISQAFNSAQGYFENFIGLNKKNLRSDLTQLGWRQYNEIKGNETLEMWEEENRNNITFSYDTKGIILAVEYKEVE